MLTQWNPFNLAQNFFLPSTPELVWGQEVIARIHRVITELNALHDDQLRQKAIELRAALAAGASIGERTTVVTAFALMKEAIRRALGITLYDVQLLAAFVLARGAIAEMQTGEGKTFAAALAAFLFSLDGKGVHIATTNAHLAERDFAQLLPAYRIVGATIGLLEERASGAAKRAAYGCDITYGTGYEFGFDYLRDQTALLNQSKPALGASRLRRLRGDPEATPTLVQRGHAYAVIDEVDSVLIDEACMPLVLSESTSVQSPSTAYLHAAEVATRLTQDVDFIIDAVQYSIKLTEAGGSLIHAAAHLPANVALERSWSEYVEQALHARHLLHRDIHYVVLGNQIAIVDGFTGRIHAERSWRNGLQQAIEAKEGMTISGPKNTTVRISRQKYFGRYAMICGMTGTAAESKREFRKVYRLSIASIPLRQPSRRKALPARYFANDAARASAIAVDVRRLHQLGRPILIGTRNIETSQRLAQVLTAAGLRFELLNGKQDRHEAEIIAQAGQLGAITIATNMAGRGTDIKLSAGVPDLGGLHLIAVGHHDSIRVDRQLIGRVARQGNPGSYQFFVSANDPLIAEGDPVLARRMQLLANSGGEIQKDFATQIARLQSRAEAARAEQRRRTWSYDQWTTDLLSQLPTSD